MTKYFGTPFGESGDQTAVPDASQPAGDVSFADGWTPDYEKDQATDPSAKDVSRQAENYLKFVITEAIKELQEYGYKMYDPLVTYPVGARVLGSDFEVYRCVFGNGPSLPQDPIDAPSIYWHHDGTIGVGQVWVDKMSSRALSTNYTNNENRSIVVNVSTSNATNACITGIIVDGVLVTSGALEPNATNRVSNSAIIPPGATYSVTVNASGVLESWEELITVIVS